MSEPIVIIVPAEEWNRVTAGLPNTFPARAEGEVLVDRVWWNQIRREHRV